MEANAAPREGTAGDAPKPVLRALQVQSAGATFSVLTTFNLTTMSTNHYDTLAPALVEAAEVGNPCHPTSSRRVCANILSENESGDQDQDTKSINSSSAYDDALEVCGAFTQPVYC